MSARWIGVIVSVMDRPVTNARCVLAALLVCAGSCAPVAVGALSGLEGPFETAELGVAPIEGVIELSAQSAWVWREGGTNRIVLDRDVVAMIGGSELKAKRAVLWLAKDGGVEGAYRVFGVFERLSTPGDVIAVRGERVPMRAVVKLTDPVKLRVGARIDGAPERKDLVELLENAERVYRERVDGEVPEAPKELRWAPKALGASGGDVRDRVIPEREATRVRSRAEQLLESYEQQRIVAAPEMTDEEREAAERARISGDVRTGSEGDDRRGAPRAVDSGEPEVRDPIFRARGIFSVAIDGKVVAQGARDGYPGTITADGGITLQYLDAARGQTIDLRAERGVVYLKEGEDSARAPAQLNADEIDGIYLEGGVLAASDDWSVRSPRVYIDLARDKMLMLDAVFWTVDQRTSMPLYLRADAVRQTALGEFEAEKARIATSSFYEPDLSVGVRDLKVSIREERGSGSGGAGAGTGDGVSGVGGGSSDPVRRVLVEGKNVTLNIGSVPVLWAPKLSADDDPVPLRDIRIGDSNRTGLAVRTRWDLFSLFGIDPIEGMDFDLQVDYYGERGPAFGVNGEWDTAQHSGSLFSYLVPSDNGTDVTSSGREIERDDETRGILSFEDIWRVQGPWTVALKGNYISDEAFIPAFFEERGWETTDFDSFVRLERTGDWTQFSLELSGSPNDFLAAEHQLQAPGYGVDKIPEARFVTMTRDLFEDEFPGLLTYQSESRIGAMRLRLSEVTPAEYGFTTLASATRAFGTDQFTSLSATQRALGLDEGAVARFDTRHELRASLDVGDIHITPFVVGRMTAYDTTFPSFNAAQTDDVRWWGGAGVTISTTLTKIDNGAQSRLLDINRIRHIVEPSITFFGADSGFAAGDVPIFDDDVEGLIRGQMIVAAVDQTWQTKRGGVGRWRDADLLKVRTELGWSDARAGMSAIPDFSDLRPELSLPGDYFGAEAVFTPTDSLAFSGSMVYDFDQDMTVRSSVGALVEHRPGFSSSIEYRDIAAIDATYLAGASRYIMSEKYTLGASASYNFDEADFQNFNATVERRFQTGTFGVQVTYNNIREETSLGFFYRLTGTSGGAGGRFGGLNGGFGDR